MSDPTREAAIGAEPSPHRHLASGAPSHDRFPLLDGYRALAATAVVVTHVGFQTGAALHGPFAGVLARLDAGVAVFFLLSGFLLYRPIASAHLRQQRGPGVRPYLWRRALRILPGYWAVVVGAALLLPVNQDVPIGRWLQQAVLLETYQPEALIPGLTQIWSLAVEVAFYLFLPVLGLVVVRLGGRDPRARLRRQLVALTVLVVGCWAYRLTVFRNGGPDLLTLTWMPAYLDWFALGMGSAVVTEYVRHTPEQSWGWCRWVRDLAFLPGVCWLVAGSLYWLSTTSLAGPLGLGPTTVVEASVKHVLYGLAALFLLLPGFLSTGRGGVIRSALASPLLRWLGTVSYGMFLWNVVMVSVAARLLGIAPFTGRFAVVLAATYVLTTAVAALSWYALERPVLRLRTFVV